MGKKSEFPFRFDVEQLTKQENEGSPLILSYGPHTFFVIFDPFSLLHSFIHHFLENYFKSIIHLSSHASFTFPFSPSQNFPPTLLFNLSKMVGFALIFSSLPYIKWQSDTTPFVSSNDVHFYILYFACIRKAHHSTV